MSFLPGMMAFMGGDTLAPLLLTEASNGSSGTIPIPAGASYARIECIGDGGDGGSSDYGHYEETGMACMQTPDGGWECFPTYTWVVDGTDYFPGGGGAYARENNYSLSGATGLYFRFSSDVYVRRNNSSGTLICSAESGGSDGGSASQCTGDVRYDGGDPSGSQGGGAAGSDGAASGNTPGPGNPAGGQGGISSHHDGYFPGGGGYQGDSSDGAPGLILITWS